jgi:hypothetical protein
MTQHLDNANPHHASDEAFNRVREERRRIELLNRRLPDTLSDAELVDLLLNRFTEQVVPPCRICGSALSVASSGGGEATKWACSGMTDDPDKVVYLAGRKCGDDHYARSYFLQHQTGDDRVLELVKRFRALAERS